MGEVYRATDTSLKRQVAIKVLPASVSMDGERLARLQREAEVLAALSHPNIATIYGLEESSGLKALVMELVEGPTLADRILDRAAFRSGRDVDRATDRPRTRGRSRAGHHPPRFETGEREAAPGWCGQGVGLRPGEGHRARDGDLAGLVEVPDHHNTRDDATGRHSRHGRVHESGAGPGTSRWTGVPIYGPSAACSTKCSPARGRSRAKMSH